MKIALFILLSFSSIFSQQDFGEDPLNSPMHVFSLPRQIAHQKSKAPGRPTLAHFDSLELLLPCRGVPVPKRASRLPNAPRTYRSGTHRGIDFFANWGTSIFAPADGVVVRADHHYKEVPPKFRVDLLEESAQVGQTPSDVFHNILLGKAVFLDHGFDLVPGYRVITIYAHMSTIDKEIVPGARVDRGDFLGRSGNTGTKDSTLGTRAGAHLHWELILQDANGEYYLGQGFPYSDLYNMLNRIFVTE